MRRTLLKLLVKAFFLASLILLGHNNLFFQDFYISRFFNTNVFISVYNFLIFWLSVNIFVRINQFIYRKRKKLGDKYSDNVIVGLQNIYFLLTGLGLIVMILGMFGVEFSKLLTALSIVAAAIAIISKDIVSDILTGFIISFSKDLALGDYVKISQFKGKVIDINIYKIVLQTDNGELIYIPNSKAYFADISNYTRKVKYQGRLELSVSLSNYLPLHQVKEIATRRISKYSDRVDVKSVAINVVSILKDEIKIEILYEQNEFNPDLTCEINANINSDILGEMERKMG